MPPRIHTAILRPLSFSTLRFRSFTTSRFLQIKEDANRSPEQVEKAKQEQLKEQRQGQGRWREDLASSGESNIAADKDKVDDHQSHMQKLQKETAEKSEKGKI